MIHEAIDSSRYLQNNISAPVLTSFANRSCCLAKSSNVPCRSALQVDLFPLAYRADPAFKMKLLRRSPLTEQANRDLKPGRIGAVFKRGRKAISHTDGDISALSASLLRASV